MACIFNWSSAVRVHDSQAYRKMDVTKECISRIFELREILLSFQTGFNLVNAAVVFAILESISGLEPSRAWNPHQLQLSPGSWSLWQSQASVYLFWSLLIKTDAKITSDNVFKITNDTCLRWFQYRLLYRVLPTSCFLYIRKLVDSTMYSLCHQVQETLSHVFLNCPKIQD